MMMMGKSVTLDNKERNKHNAHLETNPVDDLQIFHESKISKKSWKRPSQVILRQVPVIDGQEHQKIISLTKG